MKAPALFRALWLAGGLVRIVGEDHTSAHTGWIAFSHPFRVWPGVVTAFYQLLQLVTTTALALTLVWAPGLLWVPRSAAPETRLGVLPIGSR